MYNMHIATHLPVQELLSGHLQASQSIPAIALKL